MLGNNSQVGIKVEQDTQAIKLMVIFSYKHLLCIFQSFPHMRAHSRRSSLPSTVNFSTSSMSRTKSATQWYGATVVVILFLIVA